MRREDVLKLISKLTGQANIIACPRAFLTLTGGDYHAAVMLSQLLYWHDKSPDGWIAKSAQDWETEIALTRKHHDRARLLLEKTLGVILTKRQKFNGFPTLHYRLDVDSLLEMLVDEAPSDLHSGDKRECTSSTKGNVPVVQNDLHSEDKRECTGSTKPTCNRDYIQRLHTDTMVTDVTDPDFASNVSSNDAGQNSAENGKHRGFSQAQQERFDRFWAAYPRKIGKGHCRKWWKANQPDEPLLRRMISTLEVLRISAQWTRERGEYIPHPTTWLNREGWEDCAEIEPPPFNPSGREAIMAAPVESEAQKAERERRDAEREEARQRSIRALEMRRLKEAGNAAKIG